MLNLTSGETFVVIIAVIIGTVAVLTDFANAWGQRGVAKHGARIVEERTEQPKGDQ